MNRLCKINDKFLEFNMCSLSKPKFLPRNTVYLGKGKIIKSDGTTMSRHYYFYHIKYKNS